MAFRVELDEELRKLLVEAGLAEKNNPVVWSAKQLLVIK